MSEDEKAPDMPVVHRGCFVCGKALVSDGHVRDCVAKLRIKCRGFQLMARNMLLSLRVSWKEILQNGKYERAGGDVECALCRQLYYDHPELPGFPTFHLVCNGKIVKL